MSDETTAVGGEGRVRATKKLPSTRLGFTKQIEILRAFALLSGSGPVHYAKVANTVGAHDSNVSTMNPFFVENGFLVKQGAGHVPTGPVQEFARKYNWNKDTAGHALAPLVRNTWFADALLTRIHFRPVSEEDGIEVLAAACSADPDSKPQLRMLIDYLDLSGLLRRDNGQLIAISDQRAQPEMPPAPAPAAPAAEPAPVISPQATPSAGAITFQVKIDVNMADLAGWPADRIAAFFNGMAAVIAAQNAAETSGPTG